MSSTGRGKMHKITSTAVAPCPDCGYEIRLGSNHREGQIVSCPDCGADWEVINLEPLELDWAYSDPDDDWETFEED